MNENTALKHASHTKKAWTIYTLAAAAFIAFLVFVVAQDNEEIIFYGLMGSVALYVLRPTEKFMNKQILKFTGISPPPKTEESEEKETAENDSEK